MSGEASWWDTVKAGGQRLYSDAVDIVKAHQAAQAQRQQFGSNANKQTTAPPPNPPAPTAPPARTFADLVAELPEWSRLTLTVSALLLAGAVAWKAVK
jgi:hypothetical protein